jgi:hypothetical protein
MGLHRFNVMINDDAYNNIVKYQTDHGISTRDEAGQEVFEKLPYWLELEAKDKAAKEK